MPVNVGDVLRIVDEKTHGPEEHSNIGVWHVLITDGTPGTDANVMDTLATSLDDAYDLIVGNYKATFKFVRITGQNLTENEILPNTAWPTLTVGGSTGENFPYQVAAFVWWNTITPRVRGSKYLGPFTEAAAVGGIWEPTNLAQLEDFADHFLDINVGGGFNWRWGVYNADLDRFTHFTSANVQTEARTMKRRYRSRE